MKMTNLTSNTRQLFNQLLREREYRLAFQHQVLNHLRVREVKKMYIPPVMDLEPGIIEATATHPLVPLASSSRRTSHVAAESGPRTSLKEPADPATRRSPFGSSNSRRTWAVEDVAPARSSLKHCTLEKRSSQRSSSPRTSLTQSEEDAGIYEDEEGDLWSGWVEEGSDLEVDVEAAAPLKEARSDAKPGMLIDIGCATAFPQLRSGGRRLALCLSTSACTRGGAAQSSRASPPQWRRPSTCLRTAPRRWQNFGFVWHKKNGVKGTWASLRLCHPLWSNYNNYNYNPITGDFLSQFL